MEYSSITSLIIKSFYNVYNELGYGFLEKVYENAMIIELGNQNLKCEKQSPIEVFYSESKVGSYFADIVVEDVVILELKAAESLCEEHEFQLINYLKATEIEVGMLFNFGRRPEFKRKVFDNRHK